MNNDVAYTFNTMFIFRQTYTRFEFMFNPKIKLTRGSIQLFCISRIFFYISPTWDRILNKLYVYDLLSTGPRRLQPLMGCMILNSLGPCQSGKRIVEVTGTISVKGFIRDILSHLIER